MNSDDAARTARIERDPEYQALVDARQRLAWGLSALTAAIYFGFILLVAFAPGFLATPIGSGVMTLGIPIGIGVIVASCALTGLYVRRANREFDEAVRSILKRAG